MLGNSGKGKDVTGRGIENTDVPVLPILSLAKARPRAKTHVENKGPQVTPGGSLEGRELQSLAKTGEEKGKVAQRKFNSSRKKVVCLM